MEVRARLIWLWVAPSSGSGANVKDTQKFEGHISQEDAPRGLIDLS